MTQERTRPPCVPGSVVSSHGTLGTLTALMVVLGSGIDTESSSADGLAWDQLGALSISHGLA